MTDYVLPWERPLEHEKVAARKRHAPGLWGQRLEPGVPPDMPPDFAGAFSCCPMCPFACCESCRPNDEWTRFHEIEATAPNTPHRLSWWARITAQMRQEITR